MEVVTHCGFGKIRGFGGVLFVVGLAMLLGSVVASAQVVEENVNVTGRAAEGYEPGQPARQENEPSCAINPLNELNIMCAYNWYGFADMPDKQGDAWIAFSESMDGRNFIRRPLTGFKGSDHPLGEGFAADPTMLAWPGGAAVTNIVGDREGNSRMVIQRMMEINRETGFRHVSEVSQIEIAKIAGSNFIDKPDAIIIPKPGGESRPVTMTLEEYIDDDNDPLTPDTNVVTRNMPEFRIVVTFAVFNGSTQNVRTYSTYSDDFGAPGSWSNPSQITQSDGLDQGLSVAAIDNRIVYVTRRFDSGEGDGIVGAVSRDGGRKIGKVFQITDVCEFDQETAPNLDNPFRASARSNMFPWLSATGTHFVLTYAERPRDSSGNCYDDYSEIAGTRIMVRTSPDGNQWSAAVPVLSFDQEQEIDPVSGLPVAADVPVHFQFMPEVSCARGACSVIYYSTLTESISFADITGLPVSSRHWEQNPFIEDYAEFDDALGYLYYRRTVDIFANKILINPGTEAPTIVKPAERVSRYQVDYRPDEDGNVERVEIESNPLNVRIFGGNTVPFNGDYIAQGVQTWRRKSDGSGWESNAGEIGDIEDVVNRVSYFAGWTDNRRIRGPMYDDSVFEKSSDGTVVPLDYEVPAAGFGLAIPEDGEFIEQADEDQLVAGAEPLEAVTPGEPRVVRKRVSEQHRPDRFLSAYSRRAENEEDADTPTRMLCQPTEPQPESEDSLRIKNSEIYGATIEDRVRLVSPTITKTLGQVQRGFVIGSENIDPFDSRTLKLVIANQPGENLVTPGTPNSDNASIFKYKRASWRQLPFDMPFDDGSIPGGDPDPLPTVEEIVEVQPLSTEYVTLFVVTQNINNAPVTVYAYDTTYNDVSKTWSTGDLVSQITVNGESEAGALIDPVIDYVDENGDPIPVPSISVFEVHDPVFHEPIWEEIEVETLNKNFTNPNLKAPNYKAPNYKAPNYKATDYTNPNLKAPNYKAPNYKATTYEAPNLKAPNLKAPNLKAESFVDVTYTVESENNTTTAVNADFAFGGEDLDGLDVEVIAWRADEVDTLQDCEPGVITENKVISAKSNPNLKALAPADIKDPFQGTVSFPLAPKEKIQVTVRIFCATVKECDDLVKTTNPNPDYPDCLNNDSECPETLPVPSKVQSLLGYNVWAQKANTGKYEINTDNEQIIKDVIPPGFDVENGYMFRAEADDSNGAFIDLLNGIGTVGGESISTDGTEVSVGCATEFGDLPGTVPVGVANASCTATDGVGNEGIWTGTIRVEDNTPPNLVIPAPTLTRSADSVDGSGNLQATVDYLATDAFSPGTISVTDIHDPDFDQPYAAAQLLNGCEPQSGGKFVDGTVVNCIVSDHGPNSDGGVNTATGAFTINIVDSELPEFTKLPIAEVVIEARKDVAGPPPNTIPTAMELGTVEAIDNVGIDAIFNDVPADGFALGGPYVVTWTARDLAKNTATVTQKVTIQDTTPPTISVPDPITQPGTSLSSNSVAFSPPVTATDNYLLKSVGCHDQNDNLIGTEGDDFPAGLTTVTCTATDTSDNSAKANFTVTIDFDYGIIPITTSKPNAKTGTSIPVTYAWTDGGQPADISGGTQTMTAYRFATIDPVTLQCIGGEIAKNPDPGSSSFQLLPNLYWQYNFQAVDNDGNNLPVNGTSEDYCLEVKLETVVGGVQYQSGFVTLKPTNN